MASTDGVESLRIGPWGRAAVVLEIASVVYVWNWISQLAAGAVGIGATVGVHGVDFLGWAALVAPAGLALVLLALSVRGARPASIGLARPPRGWRRALLVGLAWGAVLYALTVAATWLGSLAGLETVHDAFRIDSVASWLAWLAGGLLAGAFGEELLYRGWLLERVERGLGGIVPDAWATRVSVLGGALVFGAEHAYQGTIAVVTVTLLGIGLGLAFLRSGRNLVVPIVAHGVLDVVGLTQLFLAA